MRVYRYPHGSIPTSYSQVPSISYLQYQIPNRSFLSNDCSALRDKLASQIAHVPIPRSRFL